ncbi:MAG: helix-turn-helix transcriptional regulator [Pyrinomonadaceae bacterium]
MDSRHYLHFKLIEARKLIGKSQQAIADEMGVDRQTIYRAEKGESVSYELLAQMCAYYRIPMNTVVIPFPEILAG